MAYRKALISHRIFFMSAREGSVEIFGVSAREGFDPNFSRLRKRGFCVGEGVVEVESVWVLTSGSWVWVWMNDPSIDRGFGVGVDE